MKAFFEKKVSVMGTIMIKLVLHIKMFYNYLLHIYSALFI